MSYPPVMPGTRIRTTEANWSKRTEWTDEGWAKRQWNIIGIVGIHHDSHGLCYEVTHPDGNVASYDPSEIEVLVSMADGENIQDAMELLGQPDLNATFD